MKVNLSPFRFERRRADPVSCFSFQSDHPVLDSRYLIFEAAQANHYGLNTSLALASVTTSEQPLIPLSAFRFGS